MQSKKQSFLEAFWNTFFGYTISLIVSMLVFPIFGFQATIAQSASITAIFTVTSLLRNYFVRRWFNRCK